MSFLAASKAKQVSSRYNFPSNIEAKWQSCRILCCMTLSLGCAGNVAVCRRSSYCHSPGISYFAILPSLCSTGQAFKVHPLPACYLSALQHILQPLLTISVHNILGSDGNATHFLDGIAGKSWCSAFVPVFCLTRQTRCCDSTKVSRWTLQYCLHAAFSTEDTGQGREELMGEKAKSWRQLRQHWCVALSSVWTD